jgi:preprotein translocase subunit SecA
MDYLREGIHLRGFAQIDPLVAYKNEGFEMFTGLIGAIWEEFARYIFHVEVEFEGQNGGGNQLAPAATSAARRLQYGGGGVDGQPSALAAAAAGVAADGVEYADNGDEAQFVQVETRHVDERDQIGRNDPCWCGSGKKFKKCHGA